MEQENLIQSFHVLWDSLDGSARLIRRDRSILASNPYAIRAGFSEGLICVRIGSPEIHRGCRAVQVLKERRMQVVKDDLRVRYWVPLDGIEDVYLHITVSARLGDSVMTPAQKQILGSGGPWAYSDV